MKKYIHISFTAGRGPAECGLAVQGIQMRFTKFLNMQQIDFEIVSQQFALKGAALDTIVFKIDRNFRAEIEPWLGTLQWSCKSPIRKYSKRKNWFIKCCEVAKPAPVQLGLKDISVQVYKASGPGGQHRNKVETAIRIIHHPTGRIVTATEARSKEQNRKRAFEKLETKLNGMASESKAFAKTDEWNSKLDIERGNPAKVFYGLKFTEI